MKKKLLVIVTLFSLFALSLSASQSTVTGILTDDMCTKKHMMPGKLNADCVRECIKHGAKYVIVSRGKVLQLQGDQSTLSDIAGKKVAITGELRGQVLRIESAKLAD